MLGGGRVRYGMGVGDGVGGPLPHRVGAPRVVGVGGAGTQAGMRGDVPRLPLPLRRTPTARVLPPRGCVRGGVGGGGRVALRDPHAGRRVGNALGSAGGWPRGLDGPLCAELLPLLLLELIAGLVEAARDLCGDLRRLAGRVGLGLATDGLGDHQRCLGGVRGSCGARDDHEMAGRGCGGGGERSGEAEGSREEA